VLQEINGGRLRAQHSDHHHGPVRLRADGGMEAIEPAVVTLDLPIEMEDVLTEITEVPVIRGPGAAVT